jgi:replicative DNA helicase
MSKRELGMRILSAEARVGLHHLRSGTTTAEDWTRIANVSDRVRTAPMVISDEQVNTLTQIKALCRRIQQNRGLDLVVIDYIQLLENGGRRAESRQQEVSDISRSIKLLAKELQVPVIALSQLNRGPEQRTDKKPLVSDLRESGSIEQDADMVILLHREDAYDKETPRAGEADLIVAKHRNGPTATITVAFQGHYSRFVDMAHA